MNIVFTIILILMLISVIFSIILMSHYIKVWEKPMALFSLALIPAYIGFAIIGLLYALSFAGMSDNCRLTIQLLRLLTTIGIYINGIFLFLKARITHNSLYGYAAACLFLLRGWFLLVGIGVSVLYLALEFLLLCYNKCLKPILKK